MEDGEIQDGFLGEEEMRSRKALAAAHGDEGTSVSWVEAVLLGAGRVAPVDPQENSDDPDEGEPEESAAETPREPPPPGTAADHPPPSAAVTARREAALVHSVTALLREEDAPETLLELLSEAASNGVDVARWLGHGRSSIGGRTPLMEAAMHGRTASCAALANAACSRGRGLNARNERGKYSALHYACYHGAEGAALELLVRGADPRLRNREGEAALQSALANGRTECAELVRDFLRRPTFEPEAGTSSGKSAERGGGGLGIGGVAAVAPEVCRANAVFCLGRKRRRLGARVRPGRGLGVGVGTAAAEVGLGARRGARLHATNPCSGTPMEAFVLWSIASGHDPFHGEGGDRGRDDLERGQRVEGDERGTAGVWLEYYIRVYNASLRRWYDQQTPKQAGIPHNRGAVQGRQNTAAASSCPWRESTNENGAPETGAGRGAAEAREAYTGSTYALVVEKSKALKDGRRFEIPCGANVVVGRSQNLARIVIKDEMVSKSHLRIVNSAEFGIRVSDLGSKHGAVITKPAPTKSSNQPGSATGQGVGRGGAGGRGRGRPAGLGGKDPPGALPPSSPKKQKFFPIPIPQEPEWVTGAHGDRISLGKNVMVLERKGGPEPPCEGSRRPASAAGAAAGAAAAAAEAAAAAAKPKQAPAVISKGFTVNPNLMDAIQSAQDMERARKRAAAASEAASAAAVELRSNKRARAVAAPAATARLPPSTVPRATHARNVPTMAAGVNDAAGGLDEDRDGFEHVPKGNMLLKRMGWTEGQGLGRRSDGQLQPVQVERRGERAGLGTEKGSNPFAVGPDGRMSKWEHMRRRFSETQSSGPGFRQRGAPRPSDPDVRWFKGAAEGGEGWLRGGGNADGEL